MNVFKWLVGLIFAFLGMVLWNSYQNVSLYFFTMAIVWAIAAKPDKDL